MTSRYQTPILLALGLAFAVACISPAITDPWSYAIGVECSPASKELWSLWQAITPQSTGSLGFPGTAANDHITAPAPWLAAQGLSYLGLNLIAIWNTLFVIAYVTLTVGCILLGRRISPNSPLVAQVTLLIAVVGCSAWSPLLRHLGVSALPMMLVPLVLAEIHAWIQPNARRIHGALAMMVFTLACLGSWGSATLVMLITPPLAIVVCQHIEGRQAKRRCAVALFPGLVLGSAHVVATHGSTGGLNIDPAVLRSTWMTQFEGALVLPATAAVALPSIGILLLALAGIASRPQATVGWLLTAAWGILLAAADSSAVLPAVHLIGTFPALDTLTSWWAIAPLVSIPLGIAAMKGVEALHRAQRDSLAMAVLALALLDQTIPMTALNTPQKLTPAPSAAMVDAVSTLPDGGILQLPANPENCVQTDRQRLWQPVLNRSVSTATWNGEDGAQPVSYLARLADTLANNPPNKASHDAALAPEPYRCAVEDVFTLHDLGFAAVSIDKKTDAHPALNEGLRMVLGEPIAEDNEMAVWSLADTATGQPGEPCPLPIR